MNRIAAYLEVFPVASAVFALYAVVAGAAMLLGDLTNAEYVESLLKVGAATGAIGAARMLGKVRR